MSCYKSLYTRVYHKLSFYSLLPSPFSERTTWRKNNDDAQDCTSTTLRTFLAVSFWVNSIFIQGQGDQGSGRDITLSPRTIFSDAPWVAPWILADLWEILRQEREGHLEYASPMLDESSSGQWNTIPIFGYTDVSYTVYWWYSKVDVKRQIELLEE